MEHLVSDCKDCPYQYDWQGCYHPIGISQDIIQESDEDVIDFVEGGSPVWCPLNKEPIP